MDLKTFLSSPHYIGVRDLPNNPRPKYQKRLYIAQDNLSRTVKIGWSQGGRVLSKKGVKSDWTFLWSWTLPSPSYVEQRIKSQLKKFRIKNFRETDITSPNEQYINIDSIALILLARMNILATYYSLEYIKYDKRLEALTQKLDIDNVEELVLFDAKFRPNYDTSKITENIPDNYKGVEVLDRRYINDEPEYLVKLMDKDKILTDTQLDEDRRQALKTKTGKWRKDTHLIVYWDNDRDNPDNRMKGIVVRSRQVEQIDSGDNVPGYVIKWLENNTFQTDSGEKSIPPYADEEWVELDEEWFENEFKYKNRVKPEIKLCWVQESNLTGSNEDVDENTKTNKTLVSNFMKNKSVVIENGNKNSIVVVQEWKAWNDITVRNRMQGFIKTNETKIKKLINVKSRIHINKLYDLMKLDIEEEIKTLEYDINDYEEEVEASTFSVKRKNGRWEVLMEVNNKIMELKETSPFYERIVRKYLREKEAGEKVEDTGDETPPKPYTERQKEVIDAIQKHPNFKLLDERQKSILKNIEFESDEDEEADEVYKEAKKLLDDVSKGEQGGEKEGEENEGDQENEESEIDDGDWLSGEEEEQDDEPREMEQRNRRNPKRMTRTTSIPG